jgi:hypothetical protein
MQYSDDEIQALIYEKLETPNRDYKQTLIWSKANKIDCLHIIKDILAMANTRDGGKIIFGITDSNFDFVGLSDDSYDSFDATPVNQLLHNYCDPPFTCNVVKRIFDGKKVVVIDVPEFEANPIVCKADAIYPDGKYILRKGAVYIRTKKCSSEPISTADEMRSILERGVNKKADEILATINRLLRANKDIPGQGEPVDEQAPGKSQLKFHSEIKTAVSFLDSKLETNEGYWQVIVYPSTYEPDRIPDPAKARNIVEASNVSMRGWDFPHVDIHGNTTNFNNGSQSFAGQEEAWRLYQSGLFAWRSIFREDMDERKPFGSEKVLSFVSTIYLATEILHFLKRLYLEGLNVDSVTLEITLVGCKDRKLVSYDPGIGIFNYRSAEETINISKTFSTAELRASPNEIAGDIVKKIFMLFNWNDPADSMIEGWQKKLIERRGL